jgi:hypothetical protein
MNWIIGISRVKTAFTQPWPDAGKAEDIFHHHHPPAR